MGKRIAERFHPGEFIKEEMEFRHWSIPQMAVMSMLRESEVEQLLSGEMMVSKRIAMRLSRAFGTGWKIWIRLQQQYDEWPGASNEQF